MLLSRAANIRAISTMWQRLWSSCGNNDVVWIRGHDRHSSRALAFSLSTVSLGVRVLVGLVCCWFESRALAMGRDLARRSDSRLRSRPRERDRERFRPPLSFRPSRSRPRPRDLDLSCLLFSFTVSSVSDFSFLSSELLLFSFSTLLSLSLSFSSDMFSLVTEKARTQGV